MDENLSLSSSGSGKSRKNRNENKRPPKQFFSDLYNEYKNEYLKIIWPSRQELIKQTIMVIVISAIFAVIICLLDVIFKFGHEEFVKLFVK